MSTARMVPLWRSTGRCLALRPRSSAAGAAPAAAMAAFAKSLSTASTAAAWSRVQHAVVLPGAVQPPSSHSFSTSTSTSQSTSQQPPTPPTTPPSPPQNLSENTGLPSEEENRAALQQLAALSQGLAPFDANEHGHNFGLTTASTRAAILPEDADERAAAAQAFPVAPKLQERYDPVIHQVTRLMMRDGKLAKAQRDMATVLNFLRQSPPPNLNPARPLLRGHLPAAQLPLDPAYYLALAIDSVAPLFKIRSVAGAAGGGRALPVPTPLALRQRRRTAFMWLLDSVKNKQSRGSGRGMFATRVAEEVVAIAEGRSSLWEKRQLVHKLATTARMNAGLTGKKKAFVAKVI